PCRIFYSSVLCHFFQSLSRICSRNFNGNGITGNRIYLSNGFTFFFTGCQCDGNQHQGCYFFHIIIYFLSLYYFFRDTLSRRLLHLPDSIFSQKKTVSIVFSTGGFLQDNHFFWNRKHLLMHVFLSIRLSLRQ